MNETRCKTTAALATDGTCPACGGTDCLVVLPGFGWSSPTAIASWLTLERIEAQVKRINALLDADPKEVQ